MRVFGFLSIGIRYTTITSAPTLHHYTQINRRWNAVWWLRPAAQCQRVCSQWTWTQEFMLTSENTLVASSMNDLFNHRQSEYIRPLSNIICKHTPEMPHVYQINAAVSHCLRLCCDTLCGIVESVHDLLMVSIRPNESTLADRITVNLQTEFHDECSVVPDMHKLQSTKLLYVRFAARTIRCMNECIWISIVPSLLHLHHAHTMVGRRQQWICIICTLYRVHACSGQRAQSQYGYTPAVGTLLSVFIIIIIILCLGFGCWIVAHNVIAFNSPENWMHDTHVIVIVIYTVRRAVSGHAYAINRVHCHYHYRIWESFCIYIGN